MDTSCISFSLRKRRWKAEVKAADTCGLDVDDNTARWMAEVCGVCRSLSAKRPAVADARHFPRVHGADIATGVTRTSDATSMRISPSSVESNLSQNELSARASSISKEPKRLEFYDAGHELNAADRRHWVKWLQERLRLRDVDFQVFHSAGSVTHALT
jgi:hypothetical protein